MVQDGTRQVVSAHAYHALFMRNLFIRPDRKISSISILGKDKRNIPKLSRAYLAS
jgi:ATP-dependent phosphoenolpyruvate carboxykinase